MGHADYLTIKGQICIQKEDDPFTGKPRFQYLTKGFEMSKDPTKTMIGERLFFCIKTGMPCIQRWMDRRRNEIEFNYQKKRQDALRATRREEMRQEEEHRRIYGY